MAESFLITNFFPETDYHIVLGAYLETSSEQLIQLKVRTSIWKSATLGIEEYKTEWNGSSFRVFYIIRNP